MDISTIGRVPAMVCAGTGLLTLALLSSAVRADNVVLTSGDTLKGTVTDRTSETIVVEHPILGTLEIPTGEVVTIDGVQIVAAEMVPPPPPPEWTSRFDMSFGGSFGSSDSQTLVVGFVSNRENEASRTKIDGAYFYGASDGDTTDNKATAGILHEWLLPESAWLYWASFRYDYDQFQSWDHRIGVHGGPGYQLIDREDLELVLRGGGGFSKEFGSDDEDFIWEAQAGFDLDWKLSEKQSLTLSSTIFPSLSDTGEFRTLSNAGWAYRLDETKNMALTAGVRHEYQSLVDPGIDHNDWWVFAGMGFDF